MPYFTTLVANSNEDDWKKMKRCITFLKKIKGYKRIIGSFNLKEIFTWIDTSFAVHPNIQSHTGGAMYIVYVMIH